MSPYYTKPRLSYWTAFLLFVFFFPQAGRAQSPAFAPLAATPTPLPSPGPTGQAASVLNQSLTTTGTNAPAAPVRSLTATGTITYYLPGTFPNYQKVQGTATLIVQGPDQFRLDAVLPSGTRSIARNRAAGARKLESGAYNTVPLHNNLSRGGIPFPYPGVAEALTNQTLTVSYVGQVTSGSQKLHQVRMASIFTKQQDPTGLLAHLSQTDYYIDTQTNLIVKTADLVHPIQAANVDIPRETQFESYTAFNGVQVPTVIREQIAGQTTWEFHVATVTLNTSHPDSDFIISK